MTEQIPKRISAMKEPELPDEISYGGCGPGGEYYSKDLGTHSHSLWTKGEESWTADELRAIASHQAYLKQQKCPHKNTSTELVGGGDYQTHCNDCGAEIC